MVVFEKLEDFWYYFRERTFDKLAEIAGVKYVEVQKVSNGTYSISDLKEFWNKQEEFDKNSKKTNPILFCIFRTCPDVLESIVFIPRKIYSTIRKYIKFGLLNPKHIIKTDLNIGWHDADTRIVHAIKCLVIEFVEQECSGMFDWCELDTLTDNKGLHYLQTRIDDSNETESNRFHVQNIIEVYNYFKTGRNLLVKAIDDWEYSENDIFLYNNLEKSLYEQDTKHCEMFIKSRECLWT